MQEGSARQDSPYAAGSQGVAPYQRHADSNCIDRPVYHARMGQTIVVLSAIASGEENSEHAPQYRRCRARLAELYKASPDRTHTLALNLLLGHRAM